MKRKLNYKAILSAIVFIISSLLILQTMITLVISTASLTIFGRLIALISAMIFCSTGEYLYDRI